MTDSDVSERKLEERIESFSLVFAQLPDPKIIMDANFNIISINKPFEELYGYSLEDVLGKRLSLLNAEQVTKEIQQDIYKTISTNGIWIGSLLNMTKSGHKFICETKISALIDEQGIPFAYVGTQTDITEKKKVENLKAVLYQISEAVSFSSSLEELLEIICKKVDLIIDTTNFYVALYDEEDDLYSFPYCIDEHEELTEFTPQQLRKSLTDYVRRTGAPFMSDDKTDKMLKLNGEVELVGTPSYQWLGVPLKTAKSIIGVVAVQSYSNPALYTSDDLELMTFVSEQIALAIEHKQTEEELKESEEKYRQLFDNSIIGQFITKPDGTILDCNLKFAQMFGYESKEEIKKMSAKDLYQDQKMRNKFL